jgi:hypothetical protein
MVGDHGEQPGMEKTHNRSGEPHSDELVEVWFRIDKDADGYPETRSWEGILARRTEEGYVLDSVPFYLKNVSRGDTVAAVQADFLSFNEVVSRGGHNTYRLLLVDAPDSEMRQVVSDLEKLGLTVERNENGILLAVDVPPSVDQEKVDAYLIEQVELGRWQVQDAFLSSVKTD